MQLTKQGVRDLDAIYRKKPHVPPTLTDDHVCKHWRLFNPPKGAPADQAPETLCVDCREPWHGEKKQVAAAVTPQVQSLEKLAPGLKKGKKDKKESLTKPTLKAPLV